MVEAYEEDLDALLAGGLGLHDLHGGVALAQAPAADQLEHDEPFLTVSTEFTNPGDKPLVVPLVDDLRIDAGKELLVKSPNGRGSTFWAHDRFWKQAYALDVAGLPIDMNSDARTSTIKFQIKSDDKVTLMPG